MQLLENYSLLKLNTFQIDVKTKYFVRVYDEIEIGEASDFAKNKSLPIFILGGGSNILFTKNFDGVIISPSNTGIKVTDENKDKIVIEIAAGEKWGHVVQYAIDNNYYGIENLISIPGNAGAAPIQNIGAYGVELKDTIISVNGFNIKSEKWVKLSKDECDFNYRQSIFKHDLKNTFLINTITLQLSKIPKVNLSYSNLKDYFTGRDINSLSSAEVASVIKNIRAAKLPDPEILGNSGSFFKNPIISQKLFEGIRQKYSDIPSYIVNKKQVKIPAGWLIEKCGYKGRRIMNVGTYEKQSLIIVNYGNATGTEIIKFAELIKSEVKEKFGIELEYEVNII